MRINSKGKVTIPVEIREKLVLLPGTQVDLVLEEDGVRIVPRSADRAEGRGTEVVRRLRGTGSIRMGTDEILSLTRKP